MGKIKKQLSKAIKKNNYDLAWQLLQEDYDKFSLNQVDKYNSTYLIDAVISSSLNIVDLLLKNGADINAINHTGDSALSTAIEEYYIADRIDKVKLLLTSNISPEIIKYSLHLASSSYKSSEIVKLLIDYGLDLNRQDDYGDTPLIKASLNRTGERSIIHLIRAGAKVDITNNFGINLSLGIFAYEHHQALNFIKNEKINLEGLLDRPLVYSEKIRYFFKDLAIKEILSDIDGMSELITFFSLSGKEQLAILPEIEQETKFDCGGDFYTDKALMVLALEYERCLNIFMLFEDEYCEEKYRSICYLKYLICDWIKVQNIDQDELWGRLSILKSRWILTRKSSQLLKYYLQIENNVNQESLEKIIVDSLHP